MGTFDGDSKDIRIPGSWSERVSRKVNGVEIIESESGYFGSNPTQKRQVTHHQIAEDGREMPESELKVWSWTGLRIPPDKYYTCDNHFGNHEGGRPCYKGRDGDHTDASEETFFCAECLEHNSSRKRLRKWTLGIYNPEIF